MILAFFSLDIIARARAEFHYLLFNVQLAELYKFLIMIRNLWKNSISKNLFSRTSCDAKAFSSFHNSEDRTKYESRKKVE